ncbi:MAG: 50S ribosomal protein L11 methyltransferase, partial [Chloroflexi bacterium]|nr:50S ribosomal protein L11 methyltransferase [Chloroflexota bacterium]
MIWIELSVQTSRDAVESVTELFHRIGHGGVAVEESIIPQFEGAGYTLDPDRPVSVYTYVPLDETAAERCREAETALWHLGRLAPIGDLIVRQVAEEDWAENWKAHYQVLHVGARIVVKPSWREHTPAAGEVVVELDPGMAFGTGLHASTRSCLLALERLLAPATDTDGGTVEPPRRQDRQAAVGGTPD